MDKEVEMGNVKLITDNLMTAIQYTTGYGACFEDSYVPQWLNQEFLPTLHDPEEFLVMNSIWDVGYNASKTPTRPNGTIVVNRNITPNKTYTVTVKVIDNAGWSEESGSISAITKGELKPPSITPATFNQYYNGNVTVSLTDTAEASKTRATRIIYKRTENGAEEIIEGRNGSFTISTDGTYKISACTQDAGGNRSGWTNANTFIRDASAPRPTLGTPTSTINSITVTANANETGGSRSKKLSIPIQNKCKWSMAKPW